MADAVEVFAMLDEVEVSINWGLIHLQYIYIPNILKALQCLLVPQYAFLSPFPSRLSSLKEIDFKWQPHQ